jgi:hypothetical protein
MALALLVGACAAAAGSCKIDRSVPDAPGCGDCPPPGRCQDGVCVGTPTPQLDAAMDARVDAAMDATTTPDAPSGECVEGTVESCYDGPARTAEVEPCSRGRRTCEDQVWSECRDQVLPGTERCNSTDDDCDGTADETFNLMTDVAHCGACNQPCPIGQRCCDGACFNVRSDETHCGMCGMACGAGQQCCAGACVDPQVDSAHCGPSCVQCGAGQACCAGACATLGTFQHCSMCGDACTAGLQLCCSGTCTAGLVCPP